MKYVCSICGYVYDEAKGTPWTELPPDWKCPLCGASKEQFRPENDGAAAAPAAPAASAAPANADAAPAVASPAGTAFEEDMKPLSSMELSILCSNLAKGCEKQYLSAQAEAYRNLAAWYKARADRPAEASFSGLLKKVEENLSADYPAAFDTARGCNDRGAQRALVWSEKVTMILQSLLKRYAAEGEAMLTHTGVWVCTICGFVYAGDTPPEICPVCKVPGKKLEKIGG